MIDAAWIGISVSLVGGAFAMVWRSAAVTTRVEVTMEALTKQLGRVEQMAEVIARIPALEQRIAQLEDAVVRYRSDIGELKQARAASEAVKRWSGGDVG